MAHVNTDLHGLDGPGGPSHSIGQFGRPDHPGQSGCHRKKGQPIKQRHRVEGKPTLHDIHRSARTIKIVPVLIKRLVSS